jgi:hypothetical protein
MSRIRIASIIVTCAVTALWGVAVAGVWACLLPPGATLVNLGAAVALTPCCALLWLAGALQDRVVLHLAGAVVASRRAALAVTAPLRAVRAR